MATAIGFSGNTIIEICRLLDSQVLRGAMDDHPDADLVALVSDRLYEDVVGGDGMRCTVSRHNVGGLAEGRAYGAY